MEQHLTAEGKPQFLVTDFLQNSDRFIDADSNYTNASRMPVVITVQSVRCGTYIYIHYIEDRV